MHLPPGAFISDHPTTRSRPTDDSELLPSEANEHAARMHTLIQQLSWGRTPTPKLRVVVHGSPRQASFFTRLLAEGYPNFALQMHEKALPKL